MIVTDERKNCKMYSVNYKTNVNNTGMEINVKKTRVMVISNKGDETSNPIVNGKQLEQVQQHKYLDSIIMDNLT